MNFVLPCAAGLDAYNADKIIKDHLNALKQQLKKPIIDKHQFKRFITYTFPPKIKIFHGHIFVDVISII